MLLFDVGLGWVTENGPTAMSEHAYNASECSEVLIGLRVESCDLFYAAGELEVAYSGRVCR